MKISKISTELDSIDSKRMALPEFQRSYVWTRKQVRELFVSLYKGYPVGSLLIWQVANSDAALRGDAPASGRTIDLLLDGQQRMTSLYGVIKGKAPPFFDGDNDAFSGLYFHMEEERFAFYHSATMDGDHLWVSVSDVMMGGNDKLPEFVEKSGNDMARHMTRLSKLLSIAERDLLVDDGIKADLPLDGVVDIFNRVNSGGTKLKQSDLALAKICATWPEMREKMKAQLGVWKKCEYDFSVEWLLRSVNTALTGEAKFQFLDGKSADELQQGLRIAIKKIEECLNIIKTRLGLDHARVLSAPLAIPVMVRYLVMHGDGKTKISAEERDKLLFWYLQADMWGIFSGATETAINQSIDAVDKGGITGLLNEAKRTRKLHRVGADDFNYSGVGARFYRVLYFLTCKGKALDWYTGDLLSANLLGRHSQLEKHHIFPKAQLRKQKKLNFSQGEINALANFCFLTKGTNQHISDRLPEEYFPEIEEQHPGALASQWIPEDRELWKIANYRDFLEARRVLLATEMNKQLSALLNGDDHWLESAVDAKPPIPGGVSDDDERAVLDDVNGWVVQNGLTAGDIAYEHSNAEGDPQAILDLAWPNGVQEGRGQPIALLLDEEQKTLAIANRAGFLCFDSVEELKKHIQQEHLDE